MPNTGARRGNLVYHWRHGWIPRDHFAALSKAHGSHKGAAKLMEKHGISGGHHSERTHPLGATVAARQPGIEKETHGKVVGHDDHGMLKVQYQNHRGESTVGTFNPSHTRVIGSGATTAEPHSAPHTLKPGEHATVRGVDHMGQPMTLSGKVMSNSEVSSFSRGRTTGGQPLRSISIERQDNSKRQNVVYVPDPNRGEQKRQTNSQGLAAARAETQRVQNEHLRAAAVAHGIKKPQPSAGDLSDAAAQWKRENPGKTIAGHEREVNRIAERLAERKFIGKNATGDSEAQKAAERARIKAAMASPQTTINRLAAEKAGGTNPHAARAAQLRDLAAKKRAEADRIAGSVGAPDRAGAMLRAKDSQRMNARMDSGLRRFTEKQRQAKALESKAHLADGRAKTAAEKQAAADLGMTASKLSPGDLIQHKGSAHMVTKVNRTTVSVPSIVGGSWEDKLPIGQLSKHVKVSDMKESTLRTLMSRAKGNAALQAVYMAELKRRGLAA